MSVEIDFWTRYSNLCLKSKICPLKSVIKRLKGTELCCPVEAIRSEHWPFLLAALSVDNSLTKVHFGSDLCPTTDKKEPGDKKRRKNGLNFPIPYGCSAKNISDICKCLTRLLSISKQLTILKIENLILKKEDALNLETALRNSCLEQFSLSGCELQEEALEIICRGLQLSTVKWIDFSSCGLNVSDLPSVCKIIKAHNLRRSNELFPHTLRYQLPIFDEMKGLNRITLNDNEIGDDAMEMLVNSFPDDVWIKALDLQKCCIGNEGAKALLKVAKSNVGLQLIDLRLNDIDESIVDRIALQIALNNVGKVINHKLGPLWKPHKNIKKVPQRKAYLKTQFLKHYSPPKARMVKREPARVSIMVGSDNAIYTEEASSQTMENCNNELRKAKKILSKYDSLLHQFKKYKKENHLLREEIEKMSKQDDYILIDHETFTEVKTTVEKFKKFLDVMKEYGLWECIAMLGTKEDVDNVLKPLIIDATRNCMNILNGESTVEKTLQSIDSVSFNGITNKASQIRKQLDNCNRQKQEPQSAKDTTNEIDSNLLFNSKPLHEKNYMKNPISSDKALAQKIFKEVMESYSNSSHSSGSTKPVPQLSERPAHVQQKNVPSIQALKNIVSETADKLKLKTSIAVNSKAVSSQTSATHFSDFYAQAPTTELATAEKDVKSVDPVEEISYNSSKSSTNSSSTLRKSKDIKSDLSSDYISLPNLKPHSKSLPQNENSAPELLSKKESIPDVPRSHSESSLSTERQTSSESEEKYISSKISKAKTISNKSSIRSGAHGGKFKSHSKLLSEKPLIESHLKPSSSASTVSSHSSKSSNKRKESVYSSAEENDSVKSYLESVSEASTDKDVKSLSESEVYSRVDSKKDSDGSINISKVSKEDQTQKETHVPAVEKHSEVEKNAIRSGNSKSTETKQTLEKAPVQTSDKKPKKGGGSDSSVPSLSDITTVSSHSLNTDSVMGQLSD